MTLNILLSFAQFEREITSERIRDKIAASKAQGMWMGGAGLFWMHKGFRGNFGGSLIFAAKIPNLIFLK